LLDFKPLALSSRDEYSNYFFASQERASDYSFINLWGWNDERRYETTLCEGLFWIRLTKNEPYEMWAPVGDWSGKDWKSILGKLFPDGAVFSRVPEKLTRILEGNLGDTIEVSEQRSEWEYLYSAKELAALSGNRFHKKKNLLHQFLKYNPVYEDISSENLEEIKTFQSEWCRLKECDKSDGLTAENTAVMRVLSDWEYLPGIMGGALRIDGKLAAYTIAEDIGNGTVIIHFEKGLDSYKGVYQGINQLFLKNSNWFSLVNREQDMGIPGLRQAKMTYNPAEFIRKYLVKVKVKWKS
jgi:hypothetical protein